ncbi:hypothetical protein OIU78_022376, partial [Salix suchowensis]
MPTWDLDIDTISEELCQLLG